MFSKFKNPKNSFVGDAQKLVKKRRELVKKVTSIWKIPKLFNVFFQIKSRECNFREVRDKFSWCYLVLWKAVKQGLPFLACTICGFLKLIALERLLQKTPSLMKNAVKQFTIMQFQCTFIVLSFDIQGHVTSSMK